MNELRTSKSNSPSKRSGSKVINQLHQLELIDESRREYEIEKVISSRRLKAVNRFIHIDQDDSYLMTNWHKTISTPSQTKDHLVATNLKQDVDSDIPSISNECSPRNPTQKNNPNTVKSPNLTKSYQIEQNHNQTRQNQHSSTHRYKQYEQQNVQCLIQTQKSQASTDYKSLMQSRMSESVKYHSFSPNYLTALILDENNYNYCYSCDQFDTGASHACVRKLTNLQQIFQALVRIAEMVQCLKLTQYYSLPQMISKSDTYNQLNTLYQFLKAKRDRQPKHIPDNELYILKRLINICGKKMSLLI